MGKFSSKRETIKRPPSDILEAADFIARGGIGGVPTETVYGLAADATNPDAVRKIFEAKGRPFIDPLIVHVCDMDMAREVAEFTPEAERLAAEFWPGPLTMVLKKTPLIPSITTAGMDTVAVRMPSHPAMRELIRASKPIAAPSANPFGYVSPTCAEHVRSMLGGKIDFVIDGGECACGVESTIVLMVSSPKKLLRPGPNETHNTFDRMLVELAAEDATIDNADWARITSFIDSHKAKMSEFYNGLHKRHVRPTTSTLGDNVYGRRSKQPHQGQFLS